MPPWAPNPCTLALSVAELGLALFWKMAGLLAGESGQACLPHSGSVGRGAYLLLLRCHPAPSSRVSQTRAAPALKESEEQQRPRWEELRHQGPSTSSQKENRASGPWGAVLTSGERERAGFGLPSSPSVKPRMWERGPCPLPAGERVPPTWSGIPAAALTEMEPGDAEALLVCLGV